jgi:phage/plasmid-like protein (TIGR03299 family)
MTSTLSRTSTFDNIGTKINSTGIENILNEAGMNHTISKVPLVTDSGIIIPDKVATFNEEGRYYGVVGKDYQPVSNLEAFGVVDYIEDLSIIKAGETHNGKNYIIGQLPDVSILGDDYHLHFIMQNSFDGSCGIVGAITPLRIVCTNQFNVSFRNAKSTIKIRHSRTAPERIVAAQEIWSDIASYIRNFNEQAEQYASVKLTSKEIDDVINKIFPIKDGMTERQLSTLEGNKALFRQAYVTEDNINFRNTSWGIINAYADYITHKPVKNTKNADENKFEMVTFSPYFNNILAVLNTYTH